MEKATEFATVYGITVIVPNGRIYGDGITNISGYDTRRIDMVFGIEIPFPQRSVHMVTGAVD